MVDRELFGRTWRVAVGTIETTKLRVSFKCEKSIELEPNVCDLTIYNLNDDERAQLQELEPKKGATRGIPVRIEAGYSDLYQIWLGDLRHASSRYEGNDWVTRLSSGDGEKSAKNSRIKIPLGPRTPVEAALRAVVKELGVDAGNMREAIARVKLGKTGKIFTGGKVLYGPGLRVLHDIAESADLEVSIQDGALQFLDRGKVRSSSAILLSSGSGLIGTPMVDNEGSLEAQTLMVPDMRPGSLVVIDDENVKGNFRVTHVTSIGDTHGADWGFSIKGERY